MKLLKKLLIITLSLCILACGSKVNQTNFDKIKSGMSQAEVESIIGKPKNSASMGIGEFSGSTATWETNDAKIIIQFVNDKVKIKNYHKQKAN